MDTVCSITPGQRLPNFSVSWEPPRRFVNNHTLLGPRPSFYVVEVLRYSKDREFVCLTYSQVSGSCWPGACVLTTALSGWEFDLNYKSWWRKKLSQNHHSVSVDEAALRAAHSALRSLQILKHATFFVSCLDFWIKEIIFILSSHLITCFSFFNSYLKNF